MKHTVEKKLPFITKNALILILLLGIPITITLTFFYSVYASVRNQHQQDRLLSTPTSSASDLTWGEVVPTIYFLTPRSDAKPTELYSIAADGTNKNNIYTYQDGKFLESYMLLPKNNALIVSDQQDISLIDVEKKESNKIYQIPTYKFPTSIHISPNENLVAIVLTDDRLFDKKGKKINDIGDDLVIIDINENKNNYFVDYMGSDYSNLNMYWSPDSTRLLIQNKEANGTRSDDYTYTKYTIGETQFTPSDIQEFSSTPKPDQSRSRFTFINTVTPSNINSLGQTIRTKNEVVSVDDTDVFSWRSTSFKGPDYCNSPYWLDDDVHFVIQCGHEIRVVEFSTKKVAILVEGDEPKFFPSVKK